MVFPYSSSGPLYKCSFNIETLENASSEINLETLSKTKTTMAGVRDPAFWRRFSMAVHMDEETGVPRSNTDNSEAPKPKERPAMKHT